jgi:hypothetical protein
MNKKSAPQSRQKISKSGQSPIAIGKKVIYEIFFTRDRCARFGKDGVRVSLAAPK